MLIQWVLGIDYVEAVAQEYRLWSCSFDYRDHLIVWAHAVLFNNQSLIWGFHSIKFVARSA